jgi:hypothetical protein
MAEAGVLSVSLKKKKNHLSSEQCTSPKKVFWQWEN